MKIVRSADILKIPNGLIFNSNEYAQLTGLTNIVCYALVDDKNEVRTTVSFQLNKNQAISLPRAPYGGIEVKGHVPTSELDRLVKYFIEDLGSSTLHEINLKLQPDIIPSSRITEEIAFSLANSGFVEFPKEINHHYNLSEPFMNGLHEMELRKIKKCKKSGFLFCQELSDNLAECYEFILMCRQQQGLDINIDLNMLTDAFRVFEDKYALFTIRDQTGVLLACTVTVRVSERVVYNYLPAFDRTYKAYSPLTLLYVELFNYYADIGVSALDLGISSIHGVPQIGLVKFKERMGAKRTFRRSFVFKF